MMRDGQAEGIIVSNLDRLTRDIFDMSMLLSDYFIESAKYRASFFCVGEQVDTRSASGRMTLSMRMTVFQWEREVVSERTKAALQYKKSQGVKLGRPLKRYNDVEETMAIAYIKQLNFTGLDGTISFSRKEQNVADNERITKRARIFCEGRQKGPGTIQ